MLRVSCLLVLTVLYSLSVDSIHAGDDPVWSFLENDQIKVGIKQGSGGGIGWLSMGKTEQNLVNHFDHGRLIQQSYYGIVDGSKWVDKAWRWNPVQGGDYLGLPGKILAHEKTESSLYVKTLPKHWATGEDIEDVLMEQWLRLDGPVVHVRYRMSYRGDIEHPRHDQEIPAVFVDRSLGTLVIGQEDSPARFKPGFPNERYPCPQHWAAYVDQQDFGLGVLVPEADVLTCYRVGEVGQPGACSYFAPLAIFAIRPDMVFEYDCYLTIGELEEIRKRFAALSHTREGGDAQSK